jgi:glycosyltransferase involved in cell wall biosynthesis
MRSAIQRTVRLSDVLLTNSEATKSELLRLFPRLRKPIGVTPLGIGNLGEPCDPGTVSREELKNLGVPFERFALCLGTVEPRKNLARLLEAWPLAAQKLPDTGLVVVGAKGWGGAIPSLPGRVAYLGYLDDKQLPMLFARCEFLICASLDEGFGLPVLEALHFGAPVVLSNRGALQEVAGELAVYFDPYSVEAIAAALISGFQRGADKVSLVARGMSRARLFSWEAAADSTIGWMDRAGRGGREADPG